MLTMYQLFFVGLLYITLNFCACDSMLLMIFDLKTEFLLTRKEVNRLPYSRQRINRMQKMPSMWGHQNDECGHLKLFSIIFIFI